MESRVKQLERLGIKIALTKDGCDILSRILNDGCPVKFYRNGDFTPVDCPIHWCSGYYSCKRCWNSWLKNFITKENK